MQLLVSFDVVRSRCRCAMKKVFSLSDNFAGGEKTALFRESKKFPLAESFTNFTQSRFLRTKTSFVHTFFRCPQKIPIFKNQKFFFRTKLYELSAKAAFLRTKSLLFTQTFPYCNPKLLFSTLRRPFQRPLTYCPQRMQLFF